MIGPPGCDEKQIQVHTSEGKTRDVRRGYLEHTIQSPFSVETQNLPMTPRSDPNPVLSIDQDSVGMADFEVKAIEPDPDNISKRVGKHDGSTIRQCIDTIRRTHACEESGDPKIGVNRVQLRASQPSAVNGPCVQPPIAPGYRVVEGQIVPARDRDHMVERTGIRFHLTQRSAGDRQQTAFSGYDGRHLLRQIDRGYIAVGNGVQTLAWDVEEEQAASIPDRTFTQFALETLNDSP